MRRKTDELARHATALHVAGTVLGNTPEVWHNLEQRAIKYVAALATAVYPERVGIEMAELAALRPADGYAPPEQLAEIRACPICMRRPEDTVDGRTCVGTGSRAHPEIGFALYKRVH